ncbi:discoidin domain-containing protein [Paenibacillus terrigena]|uniref:discoidin domain-containing protein n=1 Tax=Paenibacillus terrigena TaxID=369333 RepID=UPI0028D3BFAE|nr:discoidin domain-containing protein [Paenibacillus terrigena]
MKRKSIIMIVAIMMMIFGVVPVSAAPVGGMKGNAIPQGSTSTGPFYTGHGTSSAHDGDITTYWNSGSNSGTIQITFPSKTFISGVQIASVASSSSVTAYKIYGLKNGEWEVLTPVITGKVTVGNPSTPGTIDPGKVDIFEPTAIAPGEYEGIKLDTSASASWVAIAEITLLSDTKEPPTSQFNLNATAGNAKVDLSWSSITDSKGYDIKRSTSQGGPYTTIATGVTGTTYTDTNVKNGITYYYVVSAIISSGVSRESNEAFATPQGPSNPEPQPTGDRAILVVTMTTGLEKEFDLSMTEVNAFIDWYEAKSNGTGSAKFAIDKHGNNKGPFASRKDYVIFDKILTFEVSEYTTK